MKLLVLGAFLVYLYHQPCEAQGINLPSPCPCPLVKGYVCGWDGVDYMSPCWAGCRKVKVKCKGRCPCPDSTVCPTLEAPVCGNDGITYKNACNAQNNGATVKCHRPCPCPPSSCPECCLPNTNPNC
ncbi:hypothetical protein TCAL_13943 [Tigriopus californicus]|uniref:Kazal-like domain-containing protein n=1 Tax=Tigriopus californicus TaxID=6832 RepID=A0A553NYW1_TIGCA|nr:serine protease inhibitor dipetalogastin-like [Tigriopus californicus]TRY70605.1 hypothetical protein TCAL_13943 [Tigriopus californicus]|eukprot:TCALIF_13943-PA protein Name:"Protein of unknown function" AED:0.00 eAED:0.00 QI:119/1/1/1/0.5/0.66/3/111/126